MPVIENADLTKVSTTREPLPEGEYVMQISSSEMSEDNRNLIINHEITEAEDTALVGRKWPNWINLVQNDERQNEIGLSTIKRYLETIFGKGSPEAEATQPDTDILDGHSVKLYLTIDSYKDKKTKEERKNNRIKRMSRA